MKLKIAKSQIILFCIIFAGAFIRFFNPFWDNGLFLHPDERLFVNASTLSLPQSISQFFSVNSPLNPHMFYYGSFLLYLYKLASLISPFSFLITSRLISAFFSSLTIGFIYLIGKKLFSEKMGFFAAIIFTFSVGSIQYAHFNTTESSLIFLVSIITFIDIQTVKNKNPKLLLLSLALVGIATAIKITGLVFGVSPFLAALLLLREKKSYRHIFFPFIGGLAIASLLYITTNPYQFIDFRTFYIQQTYMQSVTYGTAKPPFVLIYQGTLPYLYQFISVFPFVQGFISFPLSISGCIFLIRFMLKKQKDLLLLFLFIFPLPYYLWAGGWFAKFSRYYVLLLPFLALWAAYALSHFSKRISYALLVLIALNGILYLRVYTNENTRITASKWIDTHIPSLSTIATEHWDDALPLYISGATSSYRNSTLQVYNIETTQKIIILSHQLASSDYLILSSRRVYASIEKNKSLYPQTSLLYKKLFEGRLGFLPIYHISNYPFFFSDNIADETFQSYDHPPVIIFKNAKHFSEATLQNLLATQ